MSRKDKLLHWTLQERSWGRGGGGTLVVRNHGRSPALLVPRFPNFQACSRIAEERDWRRDKERKSKGEKGREIERTFWNNNQARKVPAGVLSTTVAVNEVFRDRGVTRRPSVFEKCVRFFFFHYFIHFHEAPRSFGYSQYFRFVRIPSSRPVAFRFDGHVWVGRAHIDRSITNHNDTNCTERKQIRNS